MPSTSGPRSASLASATHSSRSQLVQPPQVGYGRSGTTATTGQVAANLELNDLGVGLINIPLCESGGSCTGSGVTGTSGTASLTNLV